MHMARADRVDAGDLRWRRNRRYQAVRRCVLLISIASVFIAPLLFLQRLQIQSSGISGGGRWAAIAAHLPSTSSPTLGAPWTVRLFRLEFLDPLAAAGLIAARSFALGALIGLLPTLILVALLGRFFCGWLCPYLPLLSASNALRSLLRRLGFEPPDLRLPRRSSFVVLAALLVATALGNSQLAPLIYPPSLIGREVFRALFFGTLGSGALVLAAAFAFDSFVSRGGFCRSLCPGGALFSLLAAASPVVIRRNVQACTDCTLCDAVCAMGQRPMTDRVDPGCDRCAKCVSVCPTGALSITFRASQERR